MTSTRKFVLEKLPGVQVRPQLSAAPPRVYGVSVVFSVAVDFADVHELPPFHESSTDELQSRRAPPAILDEVEREFSQPHGAPVRRTVGIGRGAVQAERPTRRIAPAASTRRSSAELPGSIRSPDSTPVPARSDCRERGFRSAGLDRRTRLPLRQAPAGWRPQCRALFRRHSSDFHRTCTRAPAPAGPRTALSRLAPERGLARRGERSPAPLEPSALVQLAADGAARERRRVVVDVVGARVLAQAGTGRAGIRYRHAALLDVARARRWGRRDE
jgi:hypothetical protein